jgi:hypothetical protein
VNGEDREPAPACAGAPEGGATKRRRPECDRAISIAKAARFVLAMRDGATVAQEVYRLAPSADMATFSLDRALTVLREYQRGQGKIGRRPTRGGRGWRALRRASPRWSANSTVSPNGKS